MITNPFTKQSIAENSFCPTGKGGGIDPTCSRGNGRVGTLKGAAEQRLKEMPLHEGGDLDVTGALTPPTVIRAPYVSSDSYSKQMISLAGLRHPPDQNFARPDSVEYFVKNPKELDRSLAEKPPKIIRLPDDTHMVNDGVHRLIASVLLGRTEVIAMVGSPKGAVDYVSNAFCPTGKGGGIDPTCGSGKRSTLNTSQKKTLKRASSSYKDSKVTSDPEKWESVISVQHSLGTIRDFTGSGDTKKLARLHASHQALEWLQ